MSHTVAFRTRAAAIDPRLDPSGEDQSALGAACGIAAAVVLSVPMWTLIAALAWWLTRYLLV